MNDRPVGTQSPVPGIAAWTATAIVAALSCALIVRVLLLLDRGFDFTDQSFYLMSAQRPAEYEFVYGLFGYGLHPLYNLLGGSVAGIQRAGQLILVALGGLLGLAAANRAKIDWRGPVGAQIAFVSASLPLSYYLLWLPMPSYNWFALAAGLVLLIALVHLSDTATGLRSAVAIAFVAALVMMTRPKNVVGYAALYVAAVMTAVPANRDRLIQIARAAGLAALAVMVIVALSPLSTMIDQIKTYISIFGTTHPIRFSFYDQQREFLESAWRWCVSGMVLVSTLVLRRGGRTLPMFLKVALLVFTVAILISVWRPFTHLEADTAGSATGIFAFCALTLACLRNDAPLRLIALLGLAALVPWAATLGTAAAVRSQLVFYIGVSVFVGFFGICLASNRNILTVTLASCAGLYMTFSAVELGLAKPYRLAAPVSMQLVPIELGWGSLLKVDAKTAEFLASLQKAAKEGGFCRGDIAIDLSGSMPGTVLAIGGSMPVFPWLFAGYPFSADYAREYLKRLGPVRLAQAWLITSDTANSLSVQDWQSFGVNFAAFRLAADLKFPIDGASVRLYAPAVIRRCGPVPNDAASR